MMCGRYQKYVYAKENPEENWDSNFDKSIIGKKLPKNSYWNIQLISVNNTDSRAVSQCIEGKVFSSCSLFLTTIRYDR